MPDPTESAPPVAPSDPPALAAPGRFWSTRGNWRRLFCRWWGHENVGTTSLLHGTLEVVCLRCYSRAGKWELS